MNVTLPRFLSLALILLSLLPLATRAQVFPPDLKDTYLQGWQSLGPSNLGGPTRALHVSNDGTVWAGAVGGGLWKSTNRGVSWQPVMGINNYDNRFGNRVLYISCITQDASDGTLYVGTGDIAFTQFDDTEVEDFVNGNFTTAVVGLPVGYGNVGSGVYVSTDGGQTFSNQNATWDPAVQVFETNYDVINEPFCGVQKVIARNGRVIIATLKGVYYSDDKLATVNKATDSFTAGQGLDSANVMDLEFGTDGVVYATTRNALYISTDNGATFNVRLARTDFPRPSTDPLANPNNRSRMDIAVAPNNPNVVYVSEINANGEFLGIWRKGGDNQWRQVVPRATNIGTPSNTAFSPTLDQFAGNGGQGHYAYAMAVDPADSNRIVFGGQILYEYLPSTGLRQLGSFSFIPNVNPSTYVPFYLFNLVFDPSNNNRLYMSSLREIVVSENRGYNNNRIAVGNYATAPVYSSTVSADNSRLLALSQGAGLIVNDNENNTSTFRSILNRGNGIIRASVFSPDHIVLSVPGGGVQRSINGGDNFELVTGFPKVEFCDSLTAFDGQKLAGTAPQIIPRTPMVLDEVVDEATIGQDSALSDNPVYVYFNDLDGNIFVILNVFGGQDSIPVFHRINKSINLSADRPSAMAVSGDASHTLYVGTTNGNLYRFDRAHDPLNCTGVQITLPSATPKRWISSIAVHPKDPGKLVLTYGSARVNNDPNPNCVVMVSDAQSASPTAVVLQNNLPFMPAYTALINPLVDNANDPTWLMLGTDQGIWFTNDFGTNEFPEWFPLLDYVGPNGGVEVTQNDGDMYRVPVLELYYKKWTYESATVNGKLVERLLPDVSNRLYATTYGRGVFRASRILTSVEPGLDQTGLDGKATLAVLAYPNPSHSAVNVSVNMPASGQFSAQVFGLDGRLVDELPAQNLAAGMHNVALPNANQWGAGIYMIKVTATTTNGVITGNTKVVMLD